MADDTKPPEAQPPLDAPPPPPPAPPTPAVPPNSQPKAAEVDTEAGVSTAKGSGTGALGDQVHPDTQTSEADGHRTLVQPVTDPGPYVPEGSVAAKEPDRSKGEHRYGDVNEPIPVKMRTSTGHDEGYGKPGGPVVGDVKLAPEVMVNGAASDCYHPTDGKETSITAAAVELSGKPKEPAPLHE